MCTARTVFQAESSRICYASRRLATNPHEKTLDNLPIGIMIWPTYERAVPRAPTLSGFWMEDAGMRVAGTADRAPPWAPMRDRAGRRIPEESPQAGGPPSGHHGYGEHPVPWGSQVRVHERQLRSLTQELSGG